MSQSFNYFFFLSFFVLNFVSDFKIEFARITPAAEHTTVFSTTNTFHSCLDNPLNGCRYHSHVEGKSKETLQRVFNRQGGLNLIITTELNGLIEEQV